MIRRWLHGKPVASARGRADAVPGRRAARTEPGVCRALGPGAARDSRPARRAGPAGVGDRRAFRHFAPSRVAPHSGPGARRIGDAGAHRPHQPLPFGRGADLRRGRLAQPIQQILAGSVRSPGGLAARDRTREIRNRAQGGPKQAGQAGVAPETQPIRQIATGEVSMNEHQVVTPEHWLEARKRLLAKEKQFTQLRDELSQARRELPWVRVAKEYRFEGPQGSETLAQLFAGRSQLVVYHFMFAPDWDVGSKSCSFWADHFERNVVHLGARDVTLIAISRAPLAKIEAFRKRMGWTFKWVSSENTDFNFDYHVSFTPEALANGAIFHTYSCYGRGLDMMNVAYQYLDLVPMGRNEADQGPNPQAWVRHRDNYGS